MVSDREWRPRMAVKFCPQEEPRAVTLSFRKQFYGYSRTVSDLGVYPFGVDS